MEHLHYEVFEGGSEASWFLAAVDFPEEVGAGLGVGSDASIEWVFCRCLLEWRTASYHCEENHTSSEDVNRLTSVGLS